MERRLPNRQSIRLQGYDYSCEGLYFVTICTQNNKCLFGKVAEGEMILNGVGKIAEQCWLDIPNHFSHIRLHEFVIMPNHVHGILEIVESVGANNHSPESKTLFKSPSKTIGSAIRGFKIGVTKWIRYSERTKDVSSLHVSEPIWQKNYYEHIIRNNASFVNITNYILSNPEEWKRDDYYMQNL